MDLLLAAVFATLIDLLYALMLICVFVSLLLLTAVIFYELHQRIAPVLRSRRRWREIEVARATLDEEFIAREHVGLPPREHIHRARRSA